MDAPPEGLVASGAMPFVPKALKEWAAVVRALEAGDQVVLVRRGGILDPEFAVEAPEFVFYPTWIHQMEDQVRPEFLRHVERGRGLAARGGGLTLTCLARASGSFEVRDPSALDRLLPFTLYTPEALRRRLHYREGDPLQVVPVRAYPLRAPIPLDPNPSYAGCKSWVDLAPAVAADPLAPALDDATFERRTAEIRRALGV